MTQSPSDYELIQDYLKGNESAFSILYERYKPCLFSYFNRLLQNDFASADDIFQQLWLRVIPSLHKYTNQDRFLAWVMRIAHNLVMDHYRARKVKREVAVESFDMFVSEAESKEEEMDYEVCSEALNRALENLIPVQREVVELRREGISFKEIATIQNVSLSTAIGRMHDAIANIKKFINQNPS